MEANLGTESVRFRLQLVTSALEEAVSRARTVVRAAVRCASGTTPAWQGLCPAVEHDDLGLYIEPLEGST